jgi:hypothetical protein
VVGVQQKTFLQLLQSATGASATTAAATAQEATVQAQVSCISHHQQQQLHMLLTSSNANLPWPQQQQQQQGWAASPVSHVSSLGSHAQQTAAADRHPATSLGLLLSLAGSATTQFMIHRTGAAQAAV